MARHDPAVYPGQYVTCVHDHLCEKARIRRSEGLYRDVVAVIVG